MRVSRASVLTRVGSAAAVAALATTGVMATAGAASAAAPTHPKRLYTTLTIRNKVIARAHHHADMITGVLRHNRKGLAGETVYLESRTAGKKFTVAGTGTTGTDGTVSFTVNPAKKTQYELIFKGAGNYRRSRSGVITLKVLKA